MATDRQAAGTNGNRTRERIIKIAAELFASRGYHATGMKELERATGLGRSSLYYQFESKEDLLFEIITRYLRELICVGTNLLAENLAADERLRQFSREVMGIIARDKSELTLCFREVHSVEARRQGELIGLHKQYENVWRKMLDRGVDEGVFKSSNRFVNKAILGMHHYSYLWLRPDGDAKPEEIADVFIELFLEGNRKA